MTLSPAGLALIKRFEGLRLEAYRCSAGVLTIGYGSTGKHVTPGMKITEAEAEDLLLKDVARFERGVSERIQVPVTQGQFDAMCCLAFNIGLAAFGKSTLLRLLNASQYSKAGAEFDRWTRAGGKKLPGLTKRRAAERALFEGTA